MTDVFPTILAGGSNPLDHVVDKKSALGPIIGFENLMLSTVSVVVAGIVAFLVLSVAARSIATGPASQGTDRYLTKGRLAQLIETLVQGLRDGVIEPLLGKKTSDHFLPFLLSLFFFILTLNLLGFIPFADFQSFFKKVLFSSAAGVDHGGDHSSKGAVFFGGTATASIAVTAGLATLSFFAILYQSMRDLGVKGFLEHMCVEHMCGGKELLEGPKGLLAVVTIIFENAILGLVIKPGALAIRLFANMLAGHTLLATIFMFPGMAFKAGLLLGVPIGVVSVGFAVAICFLELFVAFLQAFLFMFLTAVFISLMSHHDEHGHDHAHGHEGDHGHGHGHAHAH